MLIKKWRTEKLKWHVKYKKLKNETRNGVNSYYNIQDARSRNILIKNLK